MKKTLLFISINALTFSTLFAQEIIKGIPLTISLVKKSAKQPMLKLKDGSGILLVYKEDAIHVILSKNGKQTDFCDPMENALMIQVAEVDIEKDGKPEVVIASKTSAESMEIKVFKKADFETLYMEWSVFTSVASVEFPGNNTVKLYDKEGNAGVYKFSEEGKIIETP